MREVAWVLEERLVWGFGDRLRRAGDALRWPFERFAWIAEQRLLWPLQEWAADRGLPLRTAGLALAAIATIAAALGIALAPGNPPAPVREAAATSAGSAGFPITTIRPHKAPPSSAAPVLHGVPPDFSAQAGGTERATRGGAGSAASGAHAAKAQSGEATFSLNSPGMAGLPPAVPNSAAIDVAHRFANAFVVYETGEVNGTVRATFEETASPKLAHLLLRRPPRVPANAEIPQAKVVNVVPGPHFGNGYTVSVSLLRVGLTSELRLSMQQSKGKGGPWKVTEILG